MRQKAKNPLGNELWAWLPQYGRSHSPSIRFDEARSPMGSAVRTVSASNGLPIR